MLKNNGLKKDVRNCTYYCFDNIISINNVNSKDIKLDQKSIYNIYIYIYIYVYVFTILDMKHLMVQIPLLFIKFSNINGYIEGNIDNLIQMIT